MQRNDRCGKLRSVESLNAAERSLWEAEVGRGRKSMSRFLTVRWVNRGGGVYLVASLYSELYMGQMLQC